MSSVPPVSQSAAEFTGKPAREPIFRIPVVTGALLAANIAIHILLQLLPDRVAEPLVDWLGFSASSLAEPLAPHTLLSLITYQFIHGSWDHLGMNMISLLAFGAGVERPLGPLRFLGIYFLSGIAGALVQAFFTHAGGDDLLIGASASISGIFGALVIIWSVHRQGRRPMGLLPMILLWSAVTAFVGIAGIGSGGTPVAWIAHIAGFLAGIGLAVLMRVRGGWIKRP